MIDPGQLDYQDIIKRLSPSKDSSSYDIKDLIDILGDCSRNNFLEVVHILRALGYEWVGIDTTGMMYKELYAG